MSIVMQSRSQIYQPFFSATSSASFPFSLTSPLLGHLKSYCQLLCQLRALRYLGISRIQPHRSRPTEKLSEKLKVAKSQEADRETGRDVGMSAEKLAVKLAEKIIDELTGHRELRRQQRSCPRNHRLLIFHSPWILVYVWRLDLDHFLDVLYLLAFE